MLITFFRAITLYIVVLIVMRLMGKREIGQLQPFELAISIMIADLAATPMSKTGVPISNGIMPILGLLVMHLLISIINIKSTKAREIICGKPRTTRHSLLVGEHSFFCGVHCFGHDNFARDRKSVV